MAKTGSVTIQMKKILDEFSENVNEVLEESADSVAKEAVDELHNTSPEKTGDYARGWEVKKFRNGGVVIHNSTNYQLTHLLENGHIIKNKYGKQKRRNGSGDTTTPRKHIKPVERWANREFQKRVEEGIESI